MTKKQAKKMKKKNRRRYIITGDAALAERFAMSLAHERSSK